MRTPHELTVPGAIPAPVLRIGTAVVILGGALLLNPYPLWWWVAGAAALLSVIVPRSMASWLGIACIALGLVLTEQSAWRTALVVLLVHAAHVLASWSWAVPWRSRIRPSVLLPGVRRLLVIQAIAQTVAALMALAVPPLNGPGFAWLAPLGAAVLTGASAFALRVSLGPDPGRRPASRSAVEPGGSSPAAAPGANVGGRS
ncbi:hypothetical protein [Microbacterium sp. 13-71-7]|jgi:hypothetical protein|uniref:hypothetical protein n=1 Tax=Microbacterium sp. 13-71-7 TaxID=1970399 RepID=UPI000BD1EEE2|nr:hypothetical protein [Microbacterium sp. 13-71-7]OZB85631.1 MAG: hypothetical protein B7X32_02605 [Microbacterium sp. 13-71-7]